MTKQGADRTADSAPGPGPRGVGGQLAGLWRPVWAWLRLDLRRRWLSLLILTLLVALATGTVMAAAAGARRGAWALDRMLAVTRPTTLLPAPEPRGPGIDWAAARRLPGVAAIGTFLASGSLSIEGHPGVDASSVPMDTEIFRTVERPVVLAGRLADPARVDEVVVSQGFLKSSGLSVGDTVTAILPTPAETDARLASDGPVAPSFSGPRQQLKIVGVVRSFWWFHDKPNSPGELETTYAFTQAYRQNMLGTGDHAVGVAGLVRLRDGAAGVPAFQAAFDHLARYPVDGFDVVKAAADYRATTTFEAGALAAFALAAYLAAVVLVGQTVVRFVVGATADLGVLRTLGLTTRQTTVAAAAGPVLATTAGALAGAVAAAAVSPLFPIGSAAAVEPRPGFDVDFAVLATVVGVTVLLVAVAATTTAFAASVRGIRPARPRGSAVARLAYRAGLPAPVLTGVRFALEPGRAGAAVRPALVGAVVGVVGVLGSLTFQSGVADAAVNPARFGQTFAVGSTVGWLNDDFAPADDIEHLAATDRDVLAVNNTLVGVAAVAGQPVTLFSLDPATDRPLSVPVLSGRLPATSGEIVLAPGVARRDGVKVGDIVTVAGGNQAAGTRMRVTGLSFVPQDSHTDYNQGGWVSAAGYHALFPKGDFKYHELHVELRPGASAPVVRDRLNKAAGTGDAFYVLTDEMPIDAMNRFSGVAALPRLLGAFLGVLAVGAVGHALFVGVRRRRHEVAVLRALGMTRRQARAIVLTQAAVIVLVGVAAGVPVGVLLGRGLWRAVAASTPLIYVPPVATLALALLAPAVIVTVGLLASVPARRAARLRVPDVLRAE